MPEMTVQQAFELAVQHHQAGRLAEAEALYRQILEEEPRHADSLHHLGLIARHAGRNDVAADLIRQALASQWNNPAAHYNLGNTLRDLGQHDQAIAAYRQTITLQPEFFMAHNNLGQAMQDQGKTEEAIAAFRKAIHLKPDCPEYHNNLGNALKEAGQLYDSVASCQNAITLRPNFAEAYYNLGNTLQEMGQSDKAIAAYRQAICLLPSYSNAHINLGNVLRISGQLSAAIIAYRQALALQPDCPEAYNNLGSVLGDMGLIDEAIDACRKALSLEPCMWQAHANLVFIQNYHAGLDSFALAEEHRLLNQQHAEPLKALILPHHNERSPDRRLRVGYVSPDFRKHSVAYFLEGLLEKHDPALVEVFCYSNVLNPDAVTARMEQQAGQWRNIAHTKDEQVADLIRKDDIDILVDLAGHSARNRLPVFARKPAPVQVTWLGYPNTTGLDTVDYRISDCFADPPGSTEHLHSEQLERLPRSAWCYRPHLDTPPVTSPPTTVSGRITFGSFNAMSKINKPLIELWSKLLLAVPGSRLLLKNKAIGEPSAQEGLRTAFAQAGIAAERLEMMTWVPDSHDQMAIYGQVDIALDTFPYHGTTTTCEALWMGVPVVTLAGKTHVSRVGVSLLSNLGHPEWIAASPEEYVKIAVEMAGDITRLAELRSSLRETMQASPLMDAAGFARDMEAAYRKIWRTWCEKSESQSCPK